MKKAMMAAAGAMAAGFCFGWEFETEFSVAGDGGFPQTVDVERNSMWTHRHGRVREDGKYAILCYGNKHFVPSPALGDFTLEAEGDFECHQPRGHVGFSVFFRYDREKRTGHELSIRRRDQDGRLHVELDGEDLAVEELPFCEGATPIGLRLEVKGREGKLRAFGRHYEFALPGGGGAPEKGMVGFDVLPHHGKKLALKRVKLSSPEEPEIKWERGYKFALGQEQGANEPLYYDVKLKRYATGETELEATLGGSSLGRGERGDSGGGSAQYLGPWDRVSDPYVRIDDAEGEEYRNFYFWNGTKLLYDREMHKKYNSPSRRHKTIPWPQKVRTVLRDFPEDYRVAAGFGHLQSKPLRFCEDGPIEEVRDAAGKELWRGKSARRGGVAFRVKSPEDKEIVKKIPAGTKWRERAVEHAKKQHYFMPGEKVRFEIEAWGKAGRHSAAELAPEVKVTDFWGDREWDFGRTNAVEMASPGTGVYRLKVNGEDTLFEVVSADPKVSAAQASGIPILIEMSNEMRGNEKSAFDPLGTHGGYAHAYTVNSRDPALAERAGLWELLPLYGRKWLNWASSRVQKDMNMHSEWNKEMIRRSDWFAGGDSGPDRGTFRWGWNHEYKGGQLRILREYAKERKPGFKLLTEERLAEIAKEGKGLTAEEFEELFETCWEDFLEYAMPRGKEISDKFLEYVKSVNPRVARANYGPLATYYSTYRSVHSLRYMGMPMETGKWARESGSYWQYENYPSWCDYPYYRGSVFVGAYCLFYGRTGRRIYPEVNGTIHEWCMDDAVYNALPEEYGYLAPTHHRKMVYQYTYGTPHFRDGKYGHWDEHGYHYPHPERETLDNFFYAYGKYRKNKPVKWEKAPFILMDLEQIKRHGDRLERKTNYLDAWGGREYPEVGNTAEEGLVWAYEALVSTGWATPVFSDFAELDRIGPETCEFAVVPPIVKGTPESVKEALRRAKRRGVKLVAFEAAEGVEDVIDWFLPCAPTLSERAPYRAFWHQGSPSLDEGLKRKFVKAMEKLAPEPAVRTDEGLVTAARTAGDDIIVTLSDDPPQHGDAKEYPTSFRATLNVAGIGERGIEADGEYRVLRRERDRLELRVSRGKDTALFFKFPAKRK